MPGYFARIEGVHVHMNVNDVGSFGEPFHLAVKTCGPRADILQSELLNLGAVEKLLFQRVRVAHTHLDDMAARHRRPLARLLSPDRGGLPRPHAHPPPPPHPPPPRLHPRPNPPRSHTPPP